MEQAGETPHKPEGQQWLHEWKSPAGLCPTSVLSSEARENASKLEQQGPYSQTFLKLDLKLHLAR